MLIGSIADSAAPMTAVELAAAAVVVGASWVWVQRSPVRAGAPPMPVRAVEHCSVTLKHRFVRGELGEEDYRRLRVMAECAGIGEVGRR